MPGSIEACLITGPDHLTSSVPQVVAPLAAVLSDLLSPIGANDLLHDSKPAALAVLELSFIRSAVSKRDLAPAKQSSVAEHTWLLWMIRDVAIQIPIGVGEET